MAQIEIPFIAPKAIRLGWLSQVLEWAKNNTGTVTPQPPPEPPQQSSFEIVHLDEIPAPRTRTTLADE